MLHITGRQPLCNNSISFWWKVPLLVNGSLSWFSLLTQLIDIWLLLHIFTFLLKKRFLLRGNDLFCGLVSFEEGFVVYVNRYVIYFGDLVSSLVRFERNIVESQASDRASYSFAKIEQAACCNLVFLHEKGTKLLCLSLKMVMYLPWFTPYDRLLKFAFAKTGTLDWDLEYQWNWMCFSSPCLQEECLQLLDSLPWCWSDILQN